MALQSYCASTQVHYARLRVSLTAKTLTCQTFFICHLIVLSREELYKHECQHVYFEERACLAIKADLSALASRADLLAQGRRGRRIDDCARVCSAD